MLDARDPQRFAAALLKHARSRIHRSDIWCDPQRFAAALLKRILLTTTTPALMT